MKNQADPRHQKRVSLFQEFYTYSFNKDTEFSADLNEILQDLPEIDEAIQSFAPEWPIERLNKVDLAILRLAIWELIINGNNPEKVIIDEAIEIGKQFGSENTPKFINGVLGALLKQKISDHQTKNN